MNTIILLLGLLAALAIAASIRELVLDGYHRVRALDSQSLRDSRTCGTIAGR